VKGAASWLGVKIDVDPVILAKFHRMLPKKFPSKGPPRAYVGLRLLSPIRREMDADGVAIRASLEALPLAPAASARRGELLSQLARIELEWGMLCTYHQALLRNSELRNMRRADVELRSTRYLDGVKRTAVLTLRNCKNGVGPFFVEIPERSDRFDIFGFLANLCAWHDRREAELPLAERGSNPPLFPFSRLGFSAAATPEAPTVVLRRWLARTGLVSPAMMAAYVCHSLRHGGATDYLDHGISPEVVATIGRWCSLVWFTVYRHRTSLTSRHLEKLGYSERGLALY
jgi:integrase